MVSAVLLSWVMSTSVAVPPERYSERWLCDLWAGALCHATSCQKDGKERCLAVSKQCESTSDTATVSPDRAERKASCARALLKQACGAPRPAECDGLL